MKAQCPICNELYNNKQLTPLVLQCGHTFCQRCLKSIKKKQCFMCRQPFLKFNKNYTVISMIENSRNKIIQKTTDIEAFFKISLIGQSGVGKTSIINSFAGQMYSGNQLPTVGLGFKYISEQYKGKNYKFQLWDTGGQQKFRSVIRAHYKNSDLIIIVYSVDMPQSFEEIQNYWIKQVHQHSPNSSILLLGNKCDKAQLIHQFELSSFVQKYEALHQQVSCKQNINLRKTWMKIVNFLIQNRKKKYPNQKRSIKVNKDSKKQLIAKCFC